MPDDSIEARMEQMEAGFVIEHNSLRILRELTLVEWEDIGSDVTGRYDGSRWVLGDWMAYGEGLAFKGRMRAPTGHTIYEHAMRLTGLGEEHLAELARTSSAFPAATRTIDLPWSFYRIVKSVPGVVDDWLSWLHKCKVAQWTVREFSFKIAEYNASLRPEDKAIKHRRMRPRPDTHVKCPACSEVFPVHGNRVKNKELLTSTHV